MTNEEDFERNSKSFLDWFTSQPGTTFHPALKIVDLRQRGAGRGLIATADIPAETDLFTIPRSSIISIETSELAQKLPELFIPPQSDTTTLANDEDNEDGDSPSELPTSWLNLILILLHSSLHHETSKWTPYLSILPSNPSSFNSLMFWTPSELADLQASAITNKIGRDSANAMFNTHIIPTIKRHATTFYPPNTDPQSYLSDATLLEQCHIIGSLIMSYAFDLYPDTSPSDSDSGSETSDGWTEDHPNPNPSLSTMGMVPLADLLNADASFNAHLSHGDNALTMTSLRPIKAAEEILNYYGPLPNAELLRRYGYTSPQHARYDVVEIPWPLVKDVLLSHQSDPPISTTWKDDVLRLTNALETNGEIDATDDAFILERESGDPDEQGQCTTEAVFTKYPDELVEVITDITAQLLQKKRKASSGPDDEQRIQKRTTLTILKEIVVKRAAQYGTSIAQDEQLLGKGKVMGRQRMAVDVRLGEKKLLQEALDWTETMLLKYSVRPDQGDVSASRGQPARKKLKR